MNAAEGMDHGRTVEIQGVVLLQQTSLALLCQIGTRKHWIAPSRLQPGSTLHRSGDVGIIVVARDFALERRLIGGEQPPRPMSGASRCQSARSDGAPCAARQRPGSSFCFAHDPTTSEQREAFQAVGLANARTARAARRERASR
jgi:hypothetical protein